MKAEWIIVGQGLAGSCIARQMEAQNMDFLLVDNQLERSSSLVAAGLYNPVVFRKFNLSFQAKKLVPYLRKFFGQIESEFGVEVHQDLPIYKLFHSHEEANNWAARCTEPGFDAFMDKDLLPAGFVESAECSFGAGRVKQAGRVNLPLLLQTLQAYFLEKSLLVTGEIQDLQANTEGFELSLTDGKTIQGQKVILCDGHLAKNENWFSYLPLGATKGDVLTVKIPGLKTDGVLNKGFFILPLGDDLFRVGATYEWGNSSYDLSEKGRQELLEKLEGVVQLPYEVIDQQSGLRPTVGDRRPLIGEHPKQKGLYTFNGLGSKGVMLAPYYSEHMVDYLLGKSELDPDVDLKRYEHHWEKNQKPASGN
ncbi:FAD-dependent oxidoreductase [bacterium SCSIO 12741]|nr:FAD-dependent oxidoreductase [bacterium SCSIO 12741]